MLEVNTVEEFCSPGLKREEKGDQVCFVRLTGGRYVGGGEYDEGMQIFNASCHVQASL